MVTANIINFLHTKMNGKWFASRIVSITRETKLFNPLDEISIACVGEKLENDYTVYYMQTCKNIWLGPM